MIPMGGEGKKQAGKPAKKKVKRVGLLLMNANCGNDSVTKKKKDNGYGMVRHKLFLNGGPGSRVHGSF